ncbi:hypothetical protein I553_0486 [Mycobacterium xenopi 4042]|uniref:Uncharacterized protein n=1 Tax=Mycobacterium xenopi 4042 TaxID=1299334 RepID=X7YIA9_MYCXE|nr:hypothetical protein I553_0486 [Mycobacterium xenopi 4042]
MTFINLEDETGMVNVLCTPGVWRGTANWRRRHPHWLFAVRSKTPAAPSLSWRNSWPSSR